MASFASHRKDQFKSAIDSESTKQRRNDSIVQIRKDKKNVMMLRKRRFMPSDVKGGSTDHPRTSVKAESLAPTIQGLKSSDLEQQLVATSSIRKMVSTEDDPPIDAIIEAGCVPILVSFLRSGGFPKLQLEAAWCLSNIASGSNVHTEAVVEAGAIQPLVELFQSNDEEVREQAVWAIGNIAGDDIIHRDMILELGAFDALQRMIQGGSISMIRTTVWVLLNLCHGIPKPDFGITCSVIPVVAQLLHMSDETIVRDCCYILYYLNFGTLEDNRALDAIIESGVCLKLVELLYHPSVSVQIAALKVVGEIAKDTDTFGLQVLINCNCLHAFVTLLQSPHTDVRKHTCFAIANLACGDEKQLQRIYDANLIQPMIKMLGTETHDIKHEICIALSFAANVASAEQVNFLVEQGCMHPLCDMLSAMDSNTVFYVLDALTDILEHGENADTGTNKYAEYVESTGALDVISQISADQDNEENADLAAGLLDRFFETEDDEEADDMDQGEQFLGIDGMGNPMYSVSPNVGAQQQQHFSFD